MHEEIKLLSAVLALAPLEPDVMRFSWKTLVSFSVATGLTVAGLLFLSYLVGPPPKFLQSFPFGDDFPHGDVVHEPGSSDSSVVAASPFFSPYFIPEGQFWKGSLAFNTPSTMVVERATVVELSLSPSLSAKTLLDTLEDTSEVDTANAMITRDMRAELSGTNFNIDPVTSETQKVTVEGPTIWKWQVEPKRAGAHRLDLSLTAKIEGMFTWTIETFSRQIEVEVTWGQHFDQNWQWYAGTVLIPLFLFLAPMVRDQLMQQYWGLQTGKEENHTTPN